MKKRLLAFLLTAAVMIGLCCSAAALDNSQVSSGKNGGGSGAIVYIPLDNRPFNQDRVQRMAKSLDLELVMPEERLYATALDGVDAQRQSGDRGALLAWLMQVADKYDTFVISLDQLLSGGLMNSRCMTEMEDVTLPDGTAMSEYDVLDYLQYLSESKNVYVIDSIVRLASSNGYRGYTLDDYYETRSYGMLARPVLSGENLTVENILANYRAIPEGQQGNYNEERIQRYLKVRERKLRLTDYALRHLVASDKVNYILGVDDSSDSNNIQSNEIAYAKRFLGDDALIFSALDGLAQTVLAKIYTQRAGNQSPKVNVSYYGCSQDLIPVYNYKTVGSMIAQTVDYHGGSVTRGQGDISILVAADTGSWDTDQANFSGVIQKLQENQQGKILTILIDLTGYYSAQFHDMLLDSANLGWLLAYSGSYENPVQVAMTVSQGLARYNSLYATLSDGAQRAYVESLSAAFVKEYYASGGARSSMEEYFNERSISVWNFGSQSNAAMQRFRQRLTDEMQTGTEKLLENLGGCNFVASLSPYTLWSVQNVSAENYEFPWYRLSEISCDITAKVSSQPYHKDYHPAYIQGMDEQHFMPNGSLTRNQAAKLLVSISQTEPGTRMDCPFSDVPEWAAGYVAAAYNNHYMRGYPDGSFRGDGNITRAEFASMLVQYMSAKGLTLTAASSRSFGDVARNGDVWFADAVYTLADGGIINGYEDGTFRPDNSVTRAEAVVMLNRFFGRDEELSQELLSKQRFLDVSSDFWGYKAITEASYSHYAD